MIDFIKKHKILISAITSVVIVILVLIYVSIKMTFSASLDVLVVPTDATIMIDGEKFENGIYENLAVGKRKVVISREGFDTSEFEIELKRDEKTRLYAHLGGNQEWYDNLTDQTTLYLLDSIYEFEGQQQLKVIRAKYPIMESLPIVYEKYFNNYTEYVYYRIDGGEYEKCKTEYCLKITDFTGGNRDRALDLMREKGYNPDDYEIIYEDSSKRGYAG